MEILICEICEGALGTFDPADLAVPLTPSMFHPLEPGFPPPFQPEADWEHMFCPRCGKRAMGWDESDIEGVRRDRLRTPGGFLTFPVPHVEPGPVVPPLNPKGTIKLGTSKTGGARRGR